MLKEPAALGNATALAELIEQRLLLPHFQPISHLSDGSVHGHEALIRTPPGCRWRNKPFNDQYGYWRGDEMILLAARCITAQADPRRDFVGHVGGDDFIVLFQSDDWARRCEATLDNFNQQALALYDELARQAGGIEAEDRHGCLRFHPLTTLGIGAVRVAADGALRPRTWPMPPRWPSARSSSWASACTCWTSRWGCLRPAQPPLPPLTGAPRAVTEPQPSRGVSPRAWVAPGA